MPELIVIKKPLYYGGKERPVGASFRATEVDARFLVKTLRAEPAPDRKPVRKVAETRAPEPMTPPVSPTLDAGRYRTRRMKAED